MQYILKLCKEKYPLIWIGIILILNTTTASNMNGEEINTEIESPTTNSEGENSNRKGKTRMTDEEINDQALMEIRQKGREMLLQDGSDLISPEAREFNSKMLHYKENGIEYTDIKEAFAYRGLRPSHYIWCIYNKDKIPLHEVVSTLDKDEYLKEDSYFGEMREVLIKEIQTKTTFVLTNDSWDNYPEKKDIETEIKNQNMGRKKMSGNVEATYNTFEKRKEEVTKWIGRQYNDENINWKKGIGVGLGVGFICMGIWLYSQEQKNGIR